VNVDAFSMANLLGEVLAKFIATRDLTDGDSTKFLVEVEK